MTPRMLPSQEPEKGSKPFDRTAAAGWKKSKAWALNLQIDVKRGFKIR